MIWLAILLAVAAAILLTLSRLGPNLPAEFAAMLARETASDTTRPHPVLTEAAIAALPAPVQRYIRLSGAVGLPRPASLTVTCAAQMFSKPGAAPMTGTAVQYDRFDPPKRLFYMPTRMMGLPVKVLHDYDGTAATMRVRLAGLYTVVDASGPDFTRAETVTLLNDLCLFAPAWLNDPRLTWTAVDDLHAAVTFTNGPFTVAASLTFNPQGELINFTSQDRAEVGKDGKLTTRPWSTPISRYQTLSGQTLLGYGEAIWHDPAGDFTYGKFTVTGLTHG